MVSQKMAERSQFRDALCSAVNTPDVTVLTSLKSLLLLMRALLKGH